jgi:hypothetical protein
VAWLCADRPARQLCGRAAASSNGGRRRANRGAVSAFLLRTPNDADEGEATVALSPEAARSHGRMARTARGHVARPGAAWCLSAAHGENSRRRVHSGPQSTATDSRCPYAGLPRGRHVGVQKGARELVLERDAGCLFYFICADSKMQNSLKWQLS